MNVNKTAAAVLGLSTVLLVSACGSSSRKSTPPAHNLSARMAPHAVVTPNGKHFAVPASLRHATGAFSATLSGDNKLSWRLSYAKLGNQHLVVADIHIGPPGKFGPVLFRLCSSCTSGQNGVLTLKPSIARQLIAEKHWVTLITDKYPNGVVRGQITVRVR